MKAIWRREVSVGNGWNEHDELIETEVDILQFLYHSTGTLKAICCDTHGHIVSIDVGYLKIIK